MRRQDAVDAEVRQIFRFLIFMLIVAAVSAGLLAGLVKYDVDLSGKYDQSVGALYLTDVLGNERRIEEGNELSVKSGETIRLEAGSSVRVEILEGSRAFAYLTGPAIWRLARAERHGTLVDQVTEDDVSYRVVIEQSEGVAVYDFSQSDPSLEEFNLTLRFPDGETKPKMPCFQATAPTAETASAVLELPCPGEITPEPQATPLRLP